MCRVRSLVLSALPLSLALVACDRGSSSSEARSDDSPPSSDTASDTKTATPTSDGPTVYLTLERGGLMVLRSGGFERVENSPISRMHDYPIKLPQGGFYTYANSMVRYDGTVTDLGVAKQTHVSRPHQLTDDGKLIASGTTSVGIHDGSRWETWDMKEVLTGVEVKNASVSSAALAPDGTLYVSLPRYLAVRSPDGQWKALEPPITGYHGGELAVGADGVALFSISGGVGKKSGTFTVSGDGFNKLSSSLLPDPFVVDGVVHSLSLDGKTVHRVVEGELETVHGHSGPGRLANLQLGADGKLYALAAERRQVMRIANGEATALPREPGALPFSLNDIHDNYDVDAAGRVWLRSAYGLHVIDDDAVINLLPGQGEPIPSLVERVVVSGSGPAALPEWTNSKLITRTGKVVGKDGTPAADVTIEVCSLLISKDSPHSSQTFRGKTPCATSDDVFGKLTTDAEGRFTVADTPRFGTISVAYLDGKSWNMFLTKHGLQSCSGTPGGGTCDVGTIELENR
ncbi:hypothetical protein [Enhygromyxa salina]|uniref:Uncharacterized protein n=1 Tax=Enhygromyxa salina TaxID=215803 RepID=A0A2S9YMA0_9BACT|nr:hypothetical protein [Enhygromyxa salina]PRQ06219.1 hypothetical protein ENSA7_40670 [Enhygromyxa salina]